MASADQTTQVVIAGFGLPGRVLAQALAQRNISHCVIELNPGTVERCEKIGTPIIAGNCADREVLRQAGIEHARLFAILIPDQKSAIEATRRAREVNPSMHIVTRCHYTSAGIEAKAAGADEVIVEEQIVATEVSRLMDGQLDSLLAKIA